MSSPCSHSEFVLSGYTLDTLPPKFLYSFSQGGQVYCEDIRVLYKYVLQNKINPYTREPLCPKIIQDVVRKYFQLDSTQDEQVVAISPQPSKKPRSDIILGKFANLLKYAAPYQIQKLIEQMKQTGLLSRKFSPPTKQNLMAEFESKSNSINKYSTRELSLLYNLFSSIFEPKKPAFTQPENMSQFDLQPIWDWIHSATPTKLARFKRELLRQKLIAAPQTASVESFCDEITLQEDGAKLAQISKLTRNQFATAQNLEPLWDMILAADLAKIRQFVAACVLKELFSALCFAQALDEIKIDTTDKISQLLEPDVWQVVDIAYEKLV